MTAGKRGLGRGFSESRDDSMSRWEAEARAGVTRTTTRDRSTTLATRTRVDHCWHGGLTRPCPVKTSATDKPLKERARKQPRGQLVHSQAPRRRLTIKREGEVPAARGASATLETTETRGASIRCVPIHARHVDREKNKKSIANSRHEEDTQLHGRVEMQTKQLSANEHSTEGKDRGAIAPLKPRSPRTPMKPLSSSHQKHSLIRARSLSFDARGDKLPTSRSKGQTSVPSRAGPAWRSICLAKTEENGRSVSPIRITTVRSRGTKVSDNTRSSQTSGSGEHSRKFPRRELGARAQQPWIRNLCRQKRSRQLKKQMQFPSPHQVLQPSTHSEIFMFHFVEIYSGTALYVVSTTVVWDALEENDSTQALSTARCSRCQVRTNATSSSTRSLT